MTFQEFLLTPAVMLVVGLCVGSFINVVVYRLPRMMEAQWLGDAKETLKEFGFSEPVAPAADLGRDISVQPESLTRRSACPCCATSIDWFRLTPGLGWFFSKGRCKACQAKISLKYPIVEVLVGAVFALCSVASGSSFAGLLVALFVSALITIALIDMATMIIPDVIVLPLIWAGLLLSAYGFGFASVKDSVIGAAGSYLALRAVTEIYQFFTGVDGIGRGDMKLIAVAGAWLGWQGLFQVALVSSVCASVFGLSMMARGRLKKGEPFAFGPFLCLGTAVALPCKSLIWCTV
jgi:leader peptidase (prepilin peptidase) / N-methyltransferase